MIIPSLTYQEIIGSTKVSTRYREEGAPACTPYRQGRGHPREVPGGACSSAHRARRSAADSGSVAASHRVGTLRIGEAALVAAVSADHREAAFVTCAALVDRIKERLPVWKHQFFADGTDEWVGSC